MRGRRRAPAAAWLLAVPLLALLACDDAPAPDPHAGGPPPPVVEVVHLRPETLDAEAELLGQLEASESVVVRSEVDGVIESIGFEEGQRVQQGQVLFQLRDDEQTARLHEAEADLALAQDSFRRTRDLAKQGVVSAAQVEKVTAERAAARARAEVARVALDRTRIRAPFDGQAGARLVSPGTRVEPETDLVKVEALSSLELVFTLPEQVLPLARVGIPIELSVAPYPGERFPGEIFFVAPSVNPANRRLLVKARVPNPDLRLRPGLFAKVQSQIGRREDALLVPAGAIVYDSDGSFVWRLDAQGVAERVKVDLGTRDAERVEVRTGLAAGDVVVIAGTNKLAPGMRVESVEAPTQNAAGPPRGPGREKDASVPTPIGEGAS